MQLTQAGARVGPLHDGFFVQQRPFGQGQVGRDPRDGDPTERAFTSLPLITTQSERRQVHAWCHSQSMLRALRSGRDWHLPYSPPIEPVLEEVKQGFLHHVCHLGWEMETMLDRLHKSPSLRSFLFSSLLVPPSQACQKSHYCCYVKQKKAMLLPILRF